MLIYKILFNVNKSIQKFRNDNLVNTDINIVHAYHVRGYFIEKSPVTQRFNVLLQNRFGGLLIELYMMKENSLTHSSIFTAMIVKHILKLTFTCNVRIHYTHTHRWTEILLKFY